MLVKFVTFVIKAVNQADVLARVVLLFHRLNVEIDSLQLADRRGSETMDLSITVALESEPARRMQAQLYKVVQVRSVRIKTAGRRIVKRALV